MPRDFKIGLLVGLVIVVGIIIWVSTSDSFSLQTRRAQEYRALLEKQTQDKTNRASLTPGSSSYHPDTTGTPRKTLPVRETPTPADDLSPKPLTSETAAPAQPPVPPQEPNQPEQRRVKIKTTKFHIVRSGDTLSGISLEYYGSVRGVKKIVDANPDVLKDPDKICPGMKLIIPD